MDRPLDFLLGLPTLSDGPLWQTARTLGAPVLISANALSVWRPDRLGLRQWIGFDRRNLHLVCQHPVHLDSGGFVSAVRYRGCPSPRDRFRATPSKPPDRAGQLHRRRRTPTP